jgi:TPR repeat protein
MLANGKGIAQDHEKAVYWFRKAAEKKYSVAQANLSTMYRDGKGVRSDLRLARTWWNLALEGDSDRAFKEVGFNIFQLSRLTEIDSIE